MIDGLRRITAVVHSVVGSQSYIAALCFGSGWLSVYTSMHGLHYVALLSGIGCGMLLTGLAESLLFAPDKEDEHDRR